MPRKHPRLKPYTDDPDSKNQRNVLPKEQPKITAMFRKLDRSGGTRGRPKGSKNKKGKKKKNAGAPAATTATATAAPVSSTKPKAKRTNWGSPENVERLRKAVADWDNRANISEIAGLGKNAYCTHVGITMSTLKKYICDDVAKRLVPGAAHENKSVLTPAEQELLVQCVIRRDRANAAYTRQEIVTRIMDLRPELTDRRKVAKVWDRIHAKNKHRLTGRVKAQATTTKRSAITVAAQYRWHKLVDDTLDRMRGENKDDDSGESYESVKAHYMWNLDEECLMAMAHGDILVYCEKAARKHEKISQDSRCSTTLLRLGNAAGYQGATIILCKGKQRKQGFTDAFLEQHGMTRGSTVLMTESAFMTDEAWAKCMPILIKSMREEPVVAKHPTWRVTCTMDGFISHHNKLEPMRMAAEANITLRRTRRPSGRTGSA